MIPATSVLFDAERMRRYDRDGPRYTSYPTARQFGEGIAPNAYEWAAATSRGAREKQPLSAYIHVPFCFSPCFYCGCNRIISASSGTCIDHLRQAVSWTEIPCEVRYFDRNRVIDQMHFGGGTPTLLPKKLLIEIIDNLDKEFRLTVAENRDYSIEIDPRGTDQSMLQMLAALGFNRISLGVQDFDDNVQRAINRVQPQPRWPECTRPPGTPVPFNQFRLDLRTAATNRVVLFRYPWIAS